jgi:hypothetical protein
MRSHKSVFRGPFSFDQQFAWSGDSATRPQGGRVPRTSVAEPVTMADSDIIPADRKIGANGVSRQ